MRLMIWSVAMALKMLCGRSLPAMAETHAAGKLEEEHHTQPFAGAQEACMGARVRVHVSMGACVHAYTRGCTHACLDA